MSDEQLETNGYDADALIGFVQRIESLQSEIDQEAAEFKERCAPFREDMKQVRREAHDAGIGKQEFAAVIRRRRLEHKAAHAGDALDLAQRANYAAYLESLERLAEQVGPLGVAAAEHARARVGA
jgi:hypothetical protein